MAPALAAMTLVVGFAVLGIVLGYPDWITPLIALAIVLVAMMTGMRGGFAAALIASAVFLGWAIIHDGFDLSDVVNYRHLLFFALGLLIGYFAYGALGDFHLGRAVLRGKLSHAIRAGQVVLYYQPVAEARSGKVVSLEALVRWNHPTRGVVMPAEFVPAAEGDAATIWELTVHTLQLAIDQCGEWRRQGYDVGVAVNLSVAAIDHPELAKEITGMLSKVGLSARRLTLEVTETAVMEDTARLLPALVRIRSVERAAIAIDDFGTGYSSLARLEDLPVDTLKIDRAFTMSSDEERRNSMLKAIIDLAHQLDLTACAEGVEDRAMWDVLIELGCDTVQGYALARPMPAAQVPAWLDKSVQTDAPPTPAPAVT
jgi:EAL domain-containing protein (putative c-di-GMP-specific phosphodiesterase class I)